MVDLTTLETCCKDTCRAKTIKFPYLAVVVFLLIVSEGIIPQKNKVLDIDYSVQDSQPTPDRFLAIAVHFYCNYFSIKPPSMDHFYIGLCIWLLQEKFVTGLFN